MQDLRREVYALASVSSTRALKVNHMDLRPLDFRRKASWRTAWELLQPLATADPDGDTRPPEEFRELFAAIDQACEAYAQSIDRGIELSAQALEAADDLEGLAHELLEEADELRTIQAASRRQAPRRRLN